MEDETLTQLSPEQVVGMLGLVPESTPSKRDLMPVFRLFTAKTVKFAPAVSMAEQERRAGLVQSLTLVSHGQEQQYLFGDGITMGLLEQLEERDNYYLASREENSSRGVPVVAQTQGGTQPFSPGEEGVSFAYGPLSGYGEIQWVMPAQAAVAKGGLLGMYVDPTENKTDATRLGGLHNTTEGELGYYSPLGACLLRQNIILGALGEIDRYVSQDDRRLKLQDLTELLMRVDKDADPAMSWEEYLGGDTAKFFEDQKLRMQREIEGAQEAAKDFQADPGVNLLNPLVVCLVPGELVDKVHQEIEGRNIPAAAKKFLHQQIVRLNMDEDAQFNTKASIEVGGERLPLEVLADPKVYASLIRPNLQLVTGHDGLTDGDVEKWLRFSENLVTEERFSVVKNRLVSLTFCRPE